MRASVEVEIATNVYVDAVNFDGALSTEATVIAPVVTG
jgi:hypothetical protein